MFKGCISLEAAPALPATSLADSCYYQMFSGCKALKSAPALPATSLAVHCYQEMFNGCSSLESVPSLSHVEDFCSGALESMFCGCSSLKFSDKESSEYKNLVVVADSLGHASIFSDTSGDYTGNAVSGCAYWTSNRVV